MINKKPGGGITMNFSDEKDDLFLAAHNYSKEEALDGIKNLAELEKEPFHDVLDCGCGTGPMIELLHEKYPEKHYVGLDLTPEMINIAQAKKLSNTEFLVGDSDNLPFPE